MIEVEPFEVTTVSHDAGGSVMRVLEIANVEARTPIHSTVEAAIVAQGG